MSSLPLTCCPTMCRYRERLSKEYRYLLGTTAMKHTCYGELWVNSKKLRPGEV